MKERKIETFQLRMTPIEKETFINYCKDKHIKNKSRFVLDLIYKTIKEDNERGLLQLRNEVEINKKEQLKLEL